MKTIKKLHEFRDPPVGWYIRWRIGSGPHAGGKARGRVVGNHFNKSGQYVVETTPGGHYCYADGDRLIGISDKGSPNYVNEREERLGIEAVAARRAHEKEAAFHKRVALVSLWALAAIVFVTWAAHQ